MNLNCFIYVYYAEKEGVKRQEKFEYVKNVYNTTLVSKISI